MAKRTKSRKGKAAEQTCEFCQQKVKQGRRMSMAETMEIHWTQECTDEALLAQMGEIEDHEYVVEEAPTETEETPDPELQKAEEFLCPTCGFVARAAIGLHSHMQMHEREKERAEAYVAQAYVDPKAEVSLDLVKQQLKEFAESAMRTTAEAQEQAVTEAALYKEIAELDEIIDLLNDEVLPALLAVPEDYQDTTKIEETRKVISANVSRLATLKADPRYIRGRKVSTAVERIAKEREAKAEVARLNNEEAAKTASNPGEGWLKEQEELLLDLLNGNIWVKHPRMEMPLLKNILWRNDASCAKAGLKKASDRDWAARMEHFDKNVRDALRTFGIDLTKSYDVRITRDTWVLEEDTLEPVKIEGAENRVESFSVDEKFWLRQFRDAFYRVFQRIVKPYDFEDMDKDDEEKSLHDKALSSANVAGTGKVKRVLHEDLKHKHNKEDDTPLGRQLRDKGYLGGNRDNPRKEQPQK